MCKVNPITKEHIEQFKSTLLKRMENPDLTQEQLLVLKEQYDYITNNVHERPGSDSANSSSRNEIS